jgi:SPX domain protein involved in polyphosphate accumulation
LKTSLLKDYYYYYIAYDDLKNALKPPYEDEPSAQEPHPRRRPWTEDDEESFVALLEAELDKVFTFQRVKSGEIVRRIQVSEKEVDDVLARLDHAGPQKLSPSGMGGGTEGDGPTEEDFMLLEEDLSDIIADVHDLAKFTQLNYTGFQKIIKKHDVHGNPKLDHQTMGRQSAEQPVETHIMAPQTRFCNPAEGETVL